MTEIALIKNSICVFCGASPKVGEAYFALAQDLGARIAQDGFRLVYGGGKSGLMGATAQSAHDAGGDVLGIIPTFLVEYEGILEVVEHVKVPDMHTRKRMMYDASGAFIVLPGGIGTLEEAIEVLSWMRLDLHRKPIIFLSENDYWTPLMALIEHIIDEGFCPAEIKDHIYLVDTIDAAMAAVDDHGTRAGREAGIAGTRLLDL